MEEILVIMRATGIVRRIDDLGRIVVPKEIRKVLKKFKVVRVLNIKKKYKFDNRYI